VVGHLELKIVYIGRATASCDGLCADASSGKESLLLETTVSSIANLCCWKLETGDQGACS